MVKPRPWLVIYVILLVVFLNLSNDLSKGRGGGRGIRRRSLFLSCSLLVNNLKLQELSHVPRVAQFIRVPRVVQFRE